MAQKYEELSLLSVRSAFDHLQSTINRALQRIERQAQLNNTELFSAVKERRKLAKTLKLDQRLIHLYKSLSAEPSLKIDQGESIIHCEVTASVVLQEGHDTKVIVSLNDKKYCLQFADRAGASISFYGETFKSSNLSLTLESGEEVLTLHLELSGEQEVISEQQITRFIPGPWIYDIIHAYETLVAKENLKSINDSYSDEKLALLKQQFGL